MTKKPTRQSQQKKKRRRKENGENNECQKPLLKGQQDNHDQE